jgi:hypothetical protein
MWRNYTTFWKHPKLFLRYFLSKNYFNFKLTKIVITHTQLRFTIKCGNCDWQPIWRTSKRKLANSHAETRDIIEKPWNSQMGNRTEQGFLIFLKYDVNDTDQ